MAYAFINAPSRPSRSLVSRTSSWTTSCTNMVRISSASTGSLYQRKAQVTGVLGPNGIGKSTSFKILSGEIVPNLGRFDSPPSKEEVLQHFAGSEVSDYLSNVYSKKFRTSIKPQYVDRLPAVFKGPVIDLLRKVEERMKVDEAVALLELEEAIKRNMTDLSGGELQRVAMAATIMKDADIYFFDEPSSYLDIYQRIKIARSSSPWPRTDMSWS